MPIMCFREKMNIKIKDDSLLFYVTLYPEGWNRNQSGLFLESSAPTH